MHENRVLVMGCSPRKGGNSDFAALVMARALSDLGYDPEVVHLRDYKVLPCIGCRQCARGPDFACVQAQKDECARLLQWIDSSRLVCFASPIFFYHLPAMFKGLIDRSQSYYERSIRTRSRSMPGRALCVLLAGRKKGEQLFKGSLLTLKYFLDPFNHQVSGLCLRGLDQAGDLEKDIMAREQITDFIRLELHGTSDRQEV